MATTQVRDILIFYQQVALFDISNEATKSPVISGSDLETSLVELCCMFRISEYSNSLTRTADAELLLVSRVKLNRIRAAEKLLETETASSSNKKRKITAKDEVYISGLNGTLGENLLQFADELNVNDTSLR
ncbi:unnamed protein product [Mucor hiemalis]